MINDQNDDPFAVFGDDDEDDDDEPSFVSQQLRLEANERIKMLTSSSKSAPSTTTTTITSSNELQSSIESNTTATTLPYPIHLSWKPPLYLGPTLVLVNQQPYGRAYITNRDLSPGTLVLVEKTLFTWPEEQLGKPLDLISVQHILLQPLEYIHDLEELHPTKLHVDALLDTEIDTTTMTDNSTDTIQIIQMNNLLQQQLDPTRVNDLVTMANELFLKNRNATPLSSTDIFRLLLVLRYNGLESGIYLHVAMLNHHCQPNCVKFLPTTTTFSEVRTTRHIRAGEPLTISYISNIVCHAKRRHLLWDQHRFDIGPTQESHMELVQGTLPISQLEQYNPHSITATIEDAILALEEQVEQVPTNELSQFEHACFDLYNNAKVQLKNDEHVLFIPILRLYGTIVPAILKHNNNNKDIMALMIKMVQTGHVLLLLESQYYGSHHFCLAKTILELHQTMTQLLSSRMGTKLLQHQQHVFGTLAECSKLEQYWKREHERIKALYPYDAQEYITKMGE